MLGLNRSEKGEQKKGKSLCFSDASSDLVGRSSFHSMYNACSHQEWNEGLGGGIYLFFPFFFEYQTLHFYIILI